MSGKRPSSPRSRSRSVESTEPDIWCISRERRGPGVCQVVGEPCCGGIPIDDLVEGQLAGQRTRPLDVPAELLAEHLDQALHEQALPGGQRALLPTFGCT